MEYDYLIVGSGFFGSICAHELNKAGKNVLVIDSRNHIGGNCYTENLDGINVHKYGAHIFHTSNKKVWDYLNRFVSFNNYRHNVIANYKGDLYSLPFNMWTFNKLWGINTPAEAKAMIDSQKPDIEDPINLEEQAKKTVGHDVYEKLIKGYTEKQWGKPANELPASIIKRLPVRFTYDSNYFNDTYQGMPIGGYTQIFKKLLEGIDIKLETDYFKGDLPEHKKVIYTGPIDKFFNYKYGKLEYKTLRFDHIKITGTNNYQGATVINYTEKEIPYTRIIEHKHFENADSDITWITKEYPIKYETDVTDPYYPVNDHINNSVYRKYKFESESISDKFLFGGRLAEYKYYDMDQVIESALRFIEKEIENTK
jgi:UDP-galactopyranose mutase